MITLERARSLGRAARGASRAVANAGRTQKDAALHEVARRLGSHGDEILEANAIDLAESADLPPALLDRLRVDSARLHALAASVLAVAALPDPVGRIDRLEVRPNGLRVGRMSVPLGAVLMIYESRPNVTIDAAALCLKSGNAVVLRGGKESRHTNRVLATLFRKSLVEARLPADAVQLVDDPDRALLKNLLAQDTYFDLAIPRGGTSLISAVTEQARMPVIRHWQGICHVYVHATADLDLAERIVLNAKVQRPGVCNAMECLLVDRSVASAFVPRIVTALQAAGVEVRGCPETTALAAVTPASEADWDTEFLALVCALKVVADYEEAAAFIDRHGTRHSEAIVTRDHARAMRFLREVDASCVLVNASTRFNDGGELGLGAELGISTTKLHAYGPMGLEELCTRKFVVLGEGHIR
jgi:glutamate-5-semialdehyde dehydrogenase